MWIELDSIVSNRVVFDCNRKMFNKQEKMSYRLLIHSDSSI